MLKQQRFIKNTFLTLQTLCPFNERSDSIHKTIYLSTYKNIKMMFHPKQATIYDTLNV